MKLPADLTGRIFAAFLALAVLTTTLLSGALFLVLRDLHQAQAEAELTGLLPALVAAARDPAVTDETSLLAELRDLLPADASVAVITGAGQVITLAGADSAPFAALQPANPGALVAGTIANASERYTYAVMPLANAARPLLAGRLTGRLAILEPDDSATLALRDLVRSAATVFLIAVLAALAMAGLLARSIGAPLRRLAAATTTITAPDPSPIPESGPAEVRELTAHFNAMTAELVAGRVREAELLASLRHDLRTPLTVITGYAEAISDGAVSGEGTLRAASAIGQEAERLTRLVSMLGAAGLDDPRLEPERLVPGALLAATRERFEQAASETGVTIEVSGVGAPALWADRLALERILGNLVQNALAASPRGGRITLSADPMRRGGVEGIHLAVADEGTGFAPADLSRAFDRFWRADPSRTGVSQGLGLAIVRELARAHGGDAWAENRTPTGASVGCWLPIGGPAA